MSLGVRLMGPQRYSLCQLHTYRAGLRATGHHTSDNWRHTFDASHLRQLMSQLVSHFGWLSRHGTLFVMAGLQGFSVLPPLGPLKEDLTPLTGAITPQSSCHHWENAFASRACPMQINLTLLWEGEGCHTADQFHPVVYLSVLCTSLL